jgi:two-component system response regulator AtoC
VGPALQVKLLRVIQEQEVRRVGGTVPLKVDVRIIAATNKDLARLVKEGDFREDLFYRLNVVRMVLPPLRERREDIPMLAYHCLQKATVGSGQPPRGLVPETIEVLKRYHWPGNVRELENVIERAVSLARGPLLLPGDLPECVRETSAPADEDGLMTLEEMEKRYLVKVLRETAGNKVRAAKILGIDRRTLYRMAQRFGLQLEEETGEGAGGSLQ